MVGRFRFNQTEIHMHSAAQVAESQGLLTVMVVHDHVIVIGMLGSKSAKTVATLKGGSTICVKKVRIQNWDYYVINGIPGYEFSHGVVRQFISPIDAARLREEKPHEYWDHE